MYIIVIYNIIYDENVDIMFNILWRITSDIQACWRAVG